MRKNLEEWLTDTDFFSLTAADAQCERQQAFPCGEPHEELMLALSPAYNLHLPRAFPPTRFARLHAPQRHGPS